MAVSPWQRRIHRAQELAAQYPFAAEILGFYIHVARFQQDLHRRLTSGFPRSTPAAAIPAKPNPAELSELRSSFGSFLSLAEAHGPTPLATLSRELRAHGPHFWSELLDAAWTAHAPSDARGFLALAFLQPYAELLRTGTSAISAKAGQAPASSDAALRPSGHKNALCPFCHRKPSLGVLRPLGDGASRSLICSFCLAEWEFRRLVCPACGEENDKKLDVFTAVGFDYIRVEACATCKTYIKTVDLAKNGRADPLVDELASAPLDLWAREHGYAKLQPNLLGM